ncbi:MAG: response regulator [Bacteroidota bacterium]
MAKSKLRLLLIDDDEVNNLLFVRMVKEHRFMVSCATSLNGKKALKKLDRIVQKGGYEFPDIIIVDLLMPIMDGFEFLTVYQEKYAADYPDTRVFMVSSSIDPRDKQKAKEFSCVTNFVSKPLTLDSFRLILARTGV